MSEWVENFGFLPWTRSPECIQLQMSFLQNMKQEKKKEFIPRKCPSVLLCCATIRLPPGAHQGEVRQQENITALPTLNFLSFSASYNCLGWTLRQSQTRDHNRYVRSFTSCNSALQGSSAPCSKPWVL